MTEPTITADELVELVDLDALLDADLVYYEDDETGGVIKEHALLFVFDVDGAEWLTDLCRWLLPRRLVRGRFPTANRGLETNPDLRLFADRYRGLVERLDSVSLDGPSPMFDAATAGPLTAAGLTARQVLGDSDAHVHVLVDGRGRHVGWAMPMRSGTKGTVSIPVPAEVVQLQARIAAVGVVRVSESWQLAAALAKSDY